MEALQKEKIVDAAMPVENRTEAIGAVFLASMVERHKGDDDQVSVTSLSSRPDQGCCRRAVNGDWGVFLERPISLALLAIIAVGVVGPMLLKLRRKDSLAT